MRPVGFNLKLLSVTEEFMPEIILTFNWDGTVEKQTRGFKGKSCVKATKFIEDALGEAGERKYTKEYYDAVQYGEKEQNKQGLRY